MTVPVLWLTVAHEGRPQLRVICDSFDDEAALRLWLRCSEALPEAAELLLELQRQLDRDQLGTAW